VPLLFSVKLDLFSRPFVLKALLAFQIFDTAKPTRELKNYLRTAQQRPVCMPKGTYRVYTRLMKVHHSGSDDSQGSELDSVRTPLDF